MQTKIESNASTLSFVLGGASTPKHTEEYPQNHLQIFIGDTQEENLENLQCIKDSIAQVLFLCTDDSIILHEKAKVYLQDIYEAASKRFEEIREAE